MKVEIKPYHQKYRQQILKGWNEILVRDRMSDKQFIQTILLDENFDPNFNLVAIYQGEVVGFIWAVVRKVPYGDKGLEPDKGWIAALYVKESFQRQQIGTALVKAVEQELATRKVKEIILGAYSPHYLFPGVANQDYPTAQPFFEKQGYIKTGEAVSMERSLMGYLKPEAHLVSFEAIKADGFQFSTFNYSDTEALIEFLSEHFPGGWAHNVKQAVRNNQAEDTILILRDSQNQLAGFVQRAIDGNPTRFGPFGVRADLRGAGLGSILFHEMLSDMKAKGMTCVYFLWTSGKAQRFYERNGMHVYRSYQLMRKNRIE